MSDRVGPDSTPAEISSALPHMSDEEVDELRGAIERRIDAVGVYRDDSDLPAQVLAKLIASTPDAPRLKEVYGLVLSELERRRQSQTMLPSPAGSAAAIEFVPSANLPPLESVPQTEAPAEPLEGFYDEGFQPAGLVAGTPIDTPPPVDSGYDDGHNFGWKAQSKKPFIIGGAVLIVVLVVILAIAGAFSGDSGSKSATTEPATSNPLTSSSQAAAVTTAPPTGTSQSKPSTALSNVPLVSAAVSGVGRAGQHAGNDVWDVVTCNIRAWDGAEIKGTMSGSAVGSTVSFVATTGQVDVHNTSTHPNPAAATINTQDALVELVFAGQVSGSATCTITSVSPPPAGSKLSTDQSLWTFTNNF